MTSAELRNGDASVGQLVIRSVAELSGAGIESAQRDAELLVADTLQLDRGALVASPELSVPRAAADAVVERVRRRATREPIEYILGRCRFRGLELAVDHRVCVPWEKSGLLVEVATELGKGTLVHEVGTGCGAIALAIKQERSDLVVTGSDLSIAAIDVARANAKRLDLDVDFTVARDLPEGMYDLVVGNLPYADEEQRTMDVPPEFTRHQPHVAVFAGRDGLAVIQAVIASTPPGTRIALEHAPEQAEAVRALLRGAESRNDKSGEEGMTVGWAP